MLKTKMIDGIPVIQAEDLYPQIQNVKIIDVRRPDEFTGDLGHIAGAQIFTLGQELIDHLNTLDKSEELIFVCRSGGRSGQATAWCMQNGFRSPINMEGGMLRWNELKYPTEK